MSAKGILEAMLQWTWLLSTSVSGIEIVSKLLTFEVAVSGTDEIFKSNFWYLGLLKQSNVTLTLLPSSTMGFSEDVIRISCCLQFLLR